MPFSDEYKDVFDHGIVPAAKDRGFECYRADMGVRPNNIVREVVERIFEADAIVADLSSSSPNVFYELGVAHTIANKTIMICEEGQEIPFDVAAYRIVNYKSSVSGITEKLKDALTESLRNLDECYGTPTNPVQEVRLFEDDTAKTNVYLVAPYRNERRNDITSSALKDAGIKVSMAGELYDSTSGALREVCMNAIQLSAAIIVDLDTYGLDNAWEIGYADGLGKPVIGFSIDSEKLYNRRTVNIRHYSENPLHGWQPERYCDELDRVVSICRDRIVHVCGSKRCTNAFHLLKTALPAASQIVLPNDVRVEEHSWYTRADCRRSIDECDFALVILPQYGMDTSWQIGYAEAKNKSVHGWIAGTRVANTKDESIWEHGMHGWKERITVSSLRELAAVIVGLRGMGLLDFRSSHCHATQERT